MLSFYLTLPKNLKKKQYKKKLTKYSAQDNTHIWILRLLSVPSMQGSNMTYRPFSAFAFSGTALTNGTFTLYRSVGHTTIYCIILIIE
jgi:hypothetical protein